jgi:hypothetical protein
MIGKSTHLEFLLLVVTGGGAGLELSGLFNGLSSLGDLSLRHGTTKRETGRNQDSNLCARFKNNYCCSDFCLDRGIDNTTVVPPPPHTKYEVNTKFIQDLGVTNFHHYGTSIPSLEYNPGHFKSSAS